MRSLNAIARAYRVVRAAPSRRANNDRPRRAMAHARKPGVASDDEFERFFSANQGKTVVVLDARNSDFSVEPSDEQFGGPQGSAPIADCGTSARPNAVNCAFDRSANALRDLQVLEAKTGGNKSTPIITHCGGGGRGQKAKEYLISQGYSNVINGGGPAVEALWKTFGSM
jgi:rhodanese-related sulfurtransferase|tara:strand:- start:9907 stop:10416 length:510 start_codon:yes stop_codon:yes gene_type:complete